MPRIVAHECSVQSVSSWYCSPLINIVIVDAAERKKDGVNLATLPGSKLMNEQVCVVCLSFIVSVAFPLCSCRWAVLDGFVLGGWMFGELVWD